MMKTSFGARIVVCMVAVALVTMCSRARAQGLPFPDRHPAGAASPPPPGVRVTAGKVVKVIRIRCPGDAMCPAGR